jgi:hypothetical protein
VHLINAPFFYLNDMKIVLPKNIFSFMIEGILPEEVRKDIVYLPGAKIANEIKGKDDHIGLIPTTDLLTHKELYVSSEWGVSFEGALCNSYMYFVPEQHGINVVYLYGDISSLEVIMTKIMFKEAYNVDVEIHLASELTDAITNLVITGDFNFANGKCLTGLSLSDKITEILSLPFVNYIFSSSNNETIKKLHSLLGDAESIYERGEERLKEYNFPEESREYFLENFGSFIFNFDDQDKEGIQQLLRLPYFYGIINEISEINFV